MKKDWKETVLAGAVLAGAYIGMRAAAKRWADDKNIDDGNPYMDSPLSGEEKKRMNLYADTVKPALDRVLSFGGLVALSPLLAVISAAVWVDDPGPVLFTQKRIGRDKHYIMIHKFRTMAAATPHDVPTHKLENPEQYITRVGKILRKTSLDELPQIWDIFRGKMSVIGPRPALWNQDDLVAERDKYGANHVMPGLTGLAQISGRDELEIPEKARLDGEYCRNISFWMDCKCFLRTMIAVLHHDGVVEGGTGSMKFVLRPGVPEEDPHSILGCDIDHFDIDMERKVKILITGTESYIGESFRAYAEEHYGKNFEIDAIDMTDASWRLHPFQTGDGRPYDTVFHVAGIAHADVGKTTAAEQEKYYAVNTDLAIECARKARDAGVKQFIFMSSMIVYGGVERVTRDTIPCPANFYGDSKWQADKGVRALADENFNIAVLRPPMIYGKRSKGNYPTLSRIARKIPVFPECDNKRSMVYIENLCELLSLVMMDGKGGIFFPQNEEYSKISEIVRLIGEAAGKRVKISKALTPAVKVAMCISIGKVKGLTTKAFGSSWYDADLSLYNGLDYQKVSLDESIKRTEA